MQQKFSAFWNRIRGSRGVATLQCIGLEESRFPGAKDDFGFSRGKLLQLPGAKDTGELF